jgi:ABC-type polysaccharide/polyol phosphate transport system ATPase subunit
MTTVRFDGVSKLYRQHHMGAPDGDLWALRDVSFACGEGETVGLVGRNGCGKSTVLKLAAGVTHPSEGSVECARPVAPMLELGAGFHPDLTGRDNIRLNGALLGLGSRMTDSLIAEIVAFAETEAHIDTPVKHYSSGMYARLGFAVAVHSRARLLLVDEVLSVGDSMFQLKCQEKMKELRRGGTTILLVSHDTWWIRNFCTRAIVLQGGRVIADEEPEEALLVYERSLKGLPPQGPEGLAIGRIELFDRQGNGFEMLHGEYLRVRIEYEVKASLPPWVLAVRMRREDGVGCATCLGVPEQAQGAGSAVVEIENLYLTPGRYSVEACIEDAETARPLKIRVSTPFQVFGIYDMVRGFDGALRLQHGWKWKS